MENDIEATFSQQECSYSTPPISPTEKNPPKPPRKFQRIRKCFSPKKKKDCDRVNSPPPSPEQLLADSSNYLFANESTASIDDQPIDWEECEAKAAPRVRLDNDILHSASCVANVQSLCELCTISTQKHVGGILPAIRGRGGEDPIKQEERPKAGGFSPPRWWPSRSKEGVSGGADSSIDFLAPDTSLLSECIAGHVSPTWRYENVECDADWNLPNAEEQVDLMLHQLASKKHREVTADLAIRVDESVFKAHRFILAHYSRYFYCLVQQRQGKPFLEITLKNITPEAFSVIYEWMYTLTLSLTSDIFLDVLSAAQMLEIPEIISSCMDYLNEMVGSPHSLLLTYLEAEKRGKRTLIEHILRLLAVVYREIVCCPEFLELDCAAVRFLLSCDNLNVACEKEAFDSAVRWLVHDFSSRKPHSVEIMRYIRFGYMNDEELFDCLHNPLSEPIMNFSECRLMVLQAYLFHTSRHMGIVGKYPNLLPPPRCQISDQVDMARRNLNTTPRPKKVPEDMDLGRQYPPGPCYQGLSSSCYKPPSYSCRPKSCPGREYTCNRCPSPLPTTSTSCSGGHCSSPFQSGMETPPKFMEYCSPNRNVRFAGGVAENKGAKNKKKDQEKEGKKLKRDQGATKGDKKADKKNQTAADKKTEKTAKGHEKADANQSGKEASDKKDVTTIECNLIEDEEPIQPLTVPYDYSPQRFYTDLGAPSAEHGCKFEELSADHIVGTPEEEVVIDPHLQTAALLQAECYSRMFGQRNHSGFRYCSNPCDPCPQSCAKPCDPDCLWNVPVCYDDGSQPISCSPPPCQSRCSSPSPYYSPCCPQPRCSSPPPCLAPRCPQEPYVCTRPCCSNSQRRACGYGPCPRAATCGGNTPCVPVEVKGLHRRALRECATHNSNNRGSYNPSGSTVILVFGGLNPLESWDCDKAGKLVFIYDIGCNKWCKFDELPVPRHHAAVTSSNSCVFISGGCCPSHSNDGRKIEALRTFWCFNLRTMKWCKMSDMMCCRIHHSVVDICGRMYAMGGQDECGRILDSMECYHFASDRWHECVPMTTPRMGMAATCYRDMIWLCGGMSVKESGKGPVITKTVECFDPRKNCWCRLEPLRFPRCFSALIEYNGCLHLIGGVTRVSNKRDGVISSVAAIDVYDSRNDFWSYRTALQVPRHNASVVVACGKLYIIGGITSLEAAALDCIECYDGEDHSWQNGLEHLPFPLSGMGAVAVKLCVR